MTSEDGGIFDVTSVTFAAIVVGMVLCIVDCFPTEVAGERLAAVCMQVVGGQPDWRAVKRHMPNVHEAFEFPTVADPSDGLAGSDAAILLAVDADLAIHSLCVSDWDAAKVPASDPDWLTEAVDSLAGWQGFVVAEIMSHGSRVPDDATGFANVSADSRDVTAAAAAAAMDAPPGLDGVATAADLAMMICGSDLDGSVELPAEIGFANRVLGGFAYPLPYAAGRHPLVQVASGCNPRAEPVALADVVKHQSAHKLRTIGCLVGFVVYLMKKYVYKRYLIFGIIAIEYN